MSTAESRATIPVISMSSNRLSPDCSHRSRSSSLIVTGVRAMVRTLRSTSGRNGATSGSSFPFAFRAERASEAMAILSAPENMVPHCASDDHSRPSASTRSEGNLRSVPLMRRSENGPGGSVFDAGAMPRRLALGPLPSLSPSVSDRAEEEDRQTASDDPGPVIAERVDEAVDQGRRSR